MYKIYLSFKNWCIPCAGFFIKSYICVFVEDYVSMDKIRIFRNLNMRLIKGLLLALVSTTMIYGMDTLTDDGV
jgi:hypothetical protein